MIFGMTNAKRYAKEKYGVSLAAAERIIKAECAAHRKVKTSSWSSTGMGIVQSNSWALYDSSEVDRVFLARPVDRNQHDAIK